MNGLELVRAIRSSSELQELPVLMISAEAAVDDIDPELGVDLMLEKPFEINALLACVTFVLGRVRAGRRTVRVTRRRAASSLNRVIRRSRRSSQFGGSLAG
jgi:DNA-binding response OmpR family regulator